MGRDWETQYQNWATPTAAVELLRWFQLSIEYAPGPGVIVDPPPQEDFGETDKSWDLLYVDMCRSTPGAKRIRGLLPKNITVAHKTGTGGTQNGITSATNDIAIIDTGKGGYTDTERGGHIAIAVFVSDSSADEKTREAVIAKIAKAVWDKFGKGSRPAR